MKNVRPCHTAPTALPAMRLERNVTCPSTPSKTTSGASPAGSV